MSGPFTQPPVNPDDVGIGRTTLVITWTFTGFAILAVGLRFWVRKKFLHWNSDDWIMLLALCIHVIYEAFLTEAIHWGMGKDFENMTLEEFVQSQKWQFYSITPSQTVSVVARISIVILLVRIFGITRVWFKWFLYSLTVLQAIMGFLGILFIWIETTPVESHWDPTLPKDRHIDQRANQYTSLGLQFLFAFSDLAYVILPIAFIYRVQMPRVRKIGLILLLGLSILTAGSCIAKISIMILGLQGKLPNSFSPDFGGVVFLTSGIEQSLVITMGCIPTLGPLAKVQYGALLTAVGDSLLSLLGSRGRASPRGSGNRSVYRGGNDVELGNAKRVSDEVSGASDKNLNLVGHNRVEKYSASASAQGSDDNFNPSLKRIGTGNIRRDDSYGFTYGGGGSK